MSTDSATPASPPYLDPAEFPGESRLVRARDRIAPGETGICEELNLTGPESEGGDVETESTGALVSAVHNGTEPVAAGNLTVVTAEGPHWVIEQNG